VRAATYVLSRRHGGAGRVPLVLLLGGAALNMGAEYLLMSIAVVVIGGSSIAGGNSNVPGIWGAAMFMFLDRVDAQLLRPGRRGPAHPDRASSSSASSPWRADGARGRDRVGFPAVDPRRRPARVGALNRPFSFDHSRIAPPMPVTKPSDV
jgi:hypothetical protein